jgi:hypothetical protein
MESTIDAHIFGHTLGVAVTCKIRHRFEAGRGQAQKPIGTWEVFDVSHPLPDGTYEISSQTGGFLMRLRDGQWTLATRL